MHKNGILIYIKPVPLKEQTFMTLLQKCQYVNQRVQFLGKIN